MLKIKYFLLIFLSGMFFFSVYGKTIAAWDLTSPGVLKGKYAIKVRGKSTLDKQGLQSVSADPKQQGGAILRGNFAMLSPENAFAVNAKFCLAADFKRNANWSVICDNKYIAMPRGEKQQRYNKGFMFFLVAKGNNIYRPGAAFGYGDRSVQCFGRDITLLPGKTYTAGFLFNAVGKVFFFLDGKPAGTANVPAGKIAPSEMSFVLGDRAGANYQPLGGTLQYLEIKTAPYTPIVFSAPPAQRLVFERLEKNAAIDVELNNFSAENITGPLCIKAAVNGGKTTQITLSDLKSSSKKTLTFPVDTLLLPGTYPLTVSLLDKSGKTIAKNDISCTISPTYGDFLPVLLWGNYDDIKAIREPGFTHQIVHLFPRTGDFNARELPKWISHLDSNLKEGLYTFGTLHAHFRFLRARRYLRTDRSGKVYPRHGLEASHPAVRKEFAQAAGTTVKAMANHPAFDGVLINSEVRDSSLPSFGSGVEPAAFKKFAGYDIPGNINGKSPRPYEGDPSFPWDRVISPQHPDLVFLRWFWDVGDGWNPLQSLLSETMHKAVAGIEHKKRFFTFYDPVTRVPPMWGSGGNVDMISQWTYTYPDPIKIGQTTDEVVAMAQGKPGQKIGSMTQAIWYRSQTAPVNKKVSAPPEWLKDEPEAMFISIAPDSLREAFWSKISRRLDYIMYHGVGSLLARTDHKLYRMTNMQSKQVLKELNKTVILPLGPMLKKVPEKAFDVAILESLAASFYAPKHYPLGWGRNWMADLHLALQWGHFQPGIVYDEHLLNDRNIKDLKVLFVPGLEVVTSDVLAKLNQLRSKGVIIIGDEFTTPALMVDHRIKSITRDSNNPVKTKQELQKLGKELAGILDRYAPRKAVADNQDIVLRLRGTAKADYLFAVNDKRTFGDYIGQWKLVAAKGVATRGTVKVKTKAKAAYDLVRHRRINLKTTPSGCEFPLALAPGDGCCILLLEKPVANITVSLPGQIKRGEKFTLNIAVTDDSNRPVPAIMPVEVSLLSDSGIKLPGSGYYAAVDGKLAVNEVMPTNAPAGNIKVSVKCLASGKTVSAQSAVSGK